MTVTESSPAKLNLFLAVNGRRSDGFHDLVSVAATLVFGDELEVVRLPEKRGSFSLECSDPEVPSDERNLVLKAARAFSRAVDWGHGAAFKLTKRIPVGAGLGGGSSNAVAALRALNTLGGSPLGASALANLAAELGSDCPLFLHEGPVIMRGRGERIDALPLAARERLAGRRVLIFKPAFGVSTAWAYARMVAQATDYLPAAEAEIRLAAWIGAAGSPAEELLFNNMERAVFAKYLALPALLQRLRNRFGLAARMSGSGSACFCLLPAGAPVDEIIACIRSCWGNAAVIGETRLHG